MTECNCAWCSLGRLFAFLESVGIHGQKDIDEMLRAFRADKEKQ